MSKTKKQSTLVADIATTVLLIALGTFMAFWNKCPTRPIHIPDSLKPK